MPWHYELHKLLSEGLRSCKGLVGGTDPDRSDLGQVATAGARARDNKDNKDLLGFLIFIRFFNRKKPEPCVN